MKPNDPYETAELFTQDDFKTYLQHGWTLLDIKSGDGAYPVIYVMKKKSIQKTKRRDKNEYLELHIVIMILVRPTQRLKVILVGDALSSIRHRKT